MMLMAAMAVDLDVLWLVGFVSAGGCGDVGGRGEDGGSLFGVADPRWLCGRWSVQASPCSCQCFDHPEALGIII